jgi:hypothetical protein
VDWASVGVQAEIRIAVNRQATARVINLVLKVLPPKYEVKGFFPKPTHLGRPGNASVGHDLLSYVKILTGERKRTASSGNRCMLTAFPLFYHSNPLGMDV